MSTAPLRIAVIGAGAIAQMAHLPLLSKMRGVEVVALCDNDRPKARALADRFDVPNAFSDIEDLLELEGLDVAVIATPNHLHEPHVLSALAAGVHVLCERPLALTARGVERILAAAQKADRKVAVANNHRFRTDVQALDAFLRGGELGKITGIRTGSYRLARPGEEWRNRRAEAGGGAFMDLGLPLLDLALWLDEKATPARIAATMDRGRGANAVETTMFVQIVTDSGAALTLDLSTEYVGDEERIWFEVLGTRGSARLNPLRVVKILNGRAVDVSPTGAAARESAFLQSYRAELAHFAAVVRDETSYEPPTDQVRLLKLVEAIYRSADEGREVRA